MEPKVSLKKVISNEDKVKIGCILDKDGFLRKHYHSEEAKKIIKAFKDSRILYLVTFNHEKVYKKEVTMFYLNATVAGDGTIKSKVGDIKVTITTEDIKT